MNIGRNVPIASHVTFEPRMTIGNADKDGQVGPGRDTPYRNAVGPESVF